MYASMLNHPHSLFGQFDRLRRELDEVFGETELGGMSGLRSLPGSIRAVASGTVPAINIGRTPTSLEVYAFAPGLDASKIEVALDRGVLRIAGERASALPADNPKVNVFTHERGSGRFTRAISMPDDIDPDDVLATYRNGVLQITIGRREAAQPKRIAVQ